MSSLQFVNYKIVDMNLSSKKRIDLMFLTTSQGSRWSYDIIFDNIKYIIHNDTYLVPLGMTISLDKVDVNNKSESNIAPYLTAKAVIFGIFKFIDIDSDDSYNTKKLLIQHATEILFPYLRATLSSMLVTAGHAGVVLPIINIAKMAQNKNIKIVNFEYKKLDISKYQ
ncbi:MAG: protein-export chaperone SecB [Deltaproteobacteria bacterium]|jgi:hypothetical protein|nr:protein-export chaperone SecB [Deltaproteobacteria bacterium]